jgi:hypothetical protein
MTSSERSSCSLAALSLIFFWILPSMSWVMNPPLASISFTCCELSTVSACFSLAIKDFSGFFCEISLEMESLFEGTSVFSLVIGSLVAGFSLGGTEIDFFGVNDPDSMNFLAVGTGVPS